MRRVTLGCTTGQHLPDMSHPRRLSGVNRERGVDNTSNAQGARAGVPYTP